MNSFSQRVIAYFVGIPLALFLGYLVATPDITSIATVAFVIFCLTIPIIIQWHHNLVIIFWNSAVMLGFLPGQPRSWLVLALIGFGIALINRVLGLKSFVRVPEITRPLVLLAIVVTATGYVRGGIGLHILGSTEYGSRNYVYILVAVLGYYAFTAERISIQRCQRTASWFFLSATTFVLSNFIYVLGPAFYVLYSVITPDFVGTQVATDMGFDVINRFGGLGPASVGLLCFAMARWGIRGCLQWRKPWRYGCLLLALLAGVFCGFRSQFAFLIAIFAIQFLVEGLWKSNFVPIMALVIVCIPPLFLFSERMPKAVQRTLAFLPISISPEVREETAGSTEWRIRMWQEMSGEIPKYLFLGKGYGLDPQALYLINQASREGLLPQYEAAEFAGDYHSGPLSVLIPFGVLGTIAFLWLMCAGAKVLYLNYRNCDLRLRTINMVLFSFYTTQAVFFVLVFGSITSHLCIFLGLLGFGVSLNHGVCRKPTVRISPAPTATDAILEPA